MSELHIPDLTFPMVKYGKQESPWDFRHLLYKGGAGANLREVNNLIDNGTLGKPVAHRLPLLEKLHDVIGGRLAGGGSRSTARTSIEALRRFYSWAEDEAHSLTMKSVVSVYIEWTEHLLYRQKIVGDMNENTVYREGANLARLLDEILDLRVGLLTKTRIHKPSRRKKVLGIQADKQNLEQTIAFCHALLDITDALSVDAIRGSLPVSINFRTGQLFEEWCNLKRLDQVKALTDDYAWPYAKKIVVDARAAWEADTSLRTRYTLANLRIQAEMLIFISQTGMNLAQAHSLKMGKFRYRSHIDGYQVHRVYKGRRQGEVEFEIFSEYKVLFERYLKWRDTMFPGEEDDRLFPLVNRLGVSSDKAADVPTKFNTLRDRCKRLGISFIAPSTLRKTRINWLLRLTSDPAITAEMHAHTQETLIRNYEQPHLQVAMIEISRFHARADPTILPPGPGVCIETVPTVIPGTPPEAPIPDCTSPAGCLFCEHQRDIDCEDHVWSLASYRHFKSLEIASYRLPTHGTKPISTMATMDRVTAKLKFFKESSEVRAQWVSEAFSRIEEGNYHPRWDGFIQLMEERVWQ